MMNTRRGRDATDLHSGSTFASFLEEEGLREEVEAAAIKGVIAWQLSETMKAQRITKKAMAERMGTSRSQLDRLLDPGNPNVHLTTIARQPRSSARKSGSRWWMTLPRDAGRD